MLHQNIKKNNSRPFQIQRLCGALLSLALPQPMQPTQPVAPMQPMQRMQRVSLCFGWLWSWGWGESAHSSCLSLFSLRVPFSSLFSVIKRGDRTRFALHDGGGYAFLRYLCLRIYLRGENSDSCAALVSHLVSLSLMFFILYSISFVSLF